MRRSIIAALALLAAAASAGEPGVIHSRLESLQSGAYVLALTTQSVRIKVRSGSSDAAVALLNGTPLAASLDRGTGAPAVARALGSSALPCTRAPGVEPYRLRIDDGTAVYEQWITASCGDLVHLVGSQGLPTPRVLR